VNNNKILAENRDKMDKLFLQRASGIWEMNEKQIIMPRLVSNLTTMVFPFGYEVIEVNPSQIHFIRYISDTAGQMHTCTIGKRETKSRLEIKFKTFRTRHWIVPREKKYLSG